MSRSRHFVRAAVLAVVAVLATACGAAQTPVDLHSYTTWKQESGERIAAAGGSRLVWTGHFHTDNDQDAATFEEVFRNVYRSGMESASQLAQGG